jgi:DNA-binding CsgD family transcriptional regulator
MLDVRRVVDRAPPIYSRRMELLRDDESTPLATLTRRETEVLRRTALGETNAQIAAGLGITVHAVKFHLGSIFRKLGVPNRTMAASIYLTGALGRQEG